MTYDASSIRVMTEAEATERFEYLQVGVLTRQYPDTSTVFIARLVEACRRSGWAVEDAAARYLAGDPSRQVPPEFTAAYKDILCEERNGI